MTRDRCNVCGRFVAEEDFLADANVDAAWPDDDTYMCESCRTQNWQATYRVLKEGLTGDGSRLIEGVQVISVAAVSNTGTRDDT